MMLDYEQPLLHDSACERLKKELHISHRSGIPLNDFLYWMANESQNSWPDRSKWLLADGSTVSPSYTFAFLTLKVALWCAGSKWLRMLSNLRLYDSSLTLTASIWVSLSKFSCMSIKFKGLVGIYCLNNHICGWSRCRLLVLSLYKTMNRKKNWSMSVWKNEVIIVMKDC